MLTREQAKQKLISLGISEPTEDQITDFLNTIGTETKKEKDRADGLKAKADRADELQSQLDEINNQSLSDLEKANNRIAELEKAQAIATQKNTVIEKFKVTSEQANRIVKEDGTFDYDVLGQIISEKETAAANAKEQEIAANATNPGGGAGGSGKEKSKAEQIATNLFGGKKQDNDVLSHYVNGGK